MALGLCLSARGLAGTSPTAGQEDLRCVGGCQQLDGRAAAKAEVDALAHLRPEGGEAGLLQCELRCCLFRIGGAPARAACVSKVQSVDEHLAGSVDLLAILGFVTAAGAQTGTVGDTIKLGGTTHQLWGIDAPEARQLSSDGRPAERAAATFMRNLVRDRAIVCRGRPLDRCCRRLPYAGRQAWPGLRRYSRPPESRASMRAIPVRSVGAICGSSRLGHLSITARSDREEAVILAPLSKTGLTHRNSTPSIGAH